MYMYVCLQLHVSLHVGQRWMYLPPWLASEIGSLTETEAHASARQVDQKSQNYLSVHDTHTHPALRLEACTIMPGSYVVLEI